MILDSKLCDIQLDFYFWILVHPTSLKMHHSDLYVFRYFLSSILKINICLAPEVLGNCVDLIIYILNKSFSDGFCQAGDPEMTACNLAPRLVNENEKVSSWMHQISGMFYI